MKSHSVADEVRLRLPFSHIGCMSLQRRGEFTVHMSAQSFASKRMSHDSPKTALCREGNAGVTKFKSWGILVANNSGSARYLHLLAFIHWREATGDELFRRAWRRLGSGPEPSTEWFSWASGASSFWCSTDVRSIVGGSVDEADGAKGAFSQLRCATQKRFDLRLRMQPLTSQRWPPPWAQQKSLRLCAPLAQPACWQRRPPPCPRHSPRLTEILSQPAIWHFLPLPDAPRRRRVPASRGSGAEMYVVAGALRNSGLLVAEGIDTEIDGRCVGCGCWYDEETDDVS
jgi:hypothetical protein